MNRAQYIVISHNDAIISEADTLFGVSMKRRRQQDNQPERFRAGCFAKQILVRGLRTIYDV